ncbi:MAG: hypothetical protein H5T71_03630 [Chloroflexi bacterium]|nr:hypothetical protein [Chloroflexota bacterium]
MRHNVPFAFPPGMRGVAPRWNARGLCHRLLRSLLSQGRHRPLQRAFPPALMKQKCFLPSRAKGPKERLKGPLARRLTRQRQKVRPRPHGGQRGALRLHPVQNAPPSGG